MDMIFVKLGKSVTQMWNSVTKQTFRVQRSTLEMPVLGPERIVCSKSHARLFIVDERKLSAILQPDYWLALSNSWSELPHRSKSKCIFVLFEKFFWFNFRPPHHQRFRIRIFGSDLLSNEFTKIKEMNN